MHTISAPSLPLSVPFNSHFTAIQCEKQQLKLDYAAAAAACGKSPDTQEIIGHKCCRTFPVQLLSLPAINYALP